jgi:hypothetical protein
MRNTVSARITHCVGVSDNQNGPMKNKLLRRGSRRIEEPPQNESLGASAHRITARIPHLSARI